MKADVSEVLCCKTVQFHANVKKCSVLHKDRTFLKKDIYCMFVNQSLYVNTEEQDEYIQVKCFAYKCSPALLLHPPKVFYGQIFN